MNYKETIKKLDYDKLKNHAYILKVDANYDTDLSLELVKHMLSFEINDCEYLDQINYLIDKNIFQDLKIIKPIGQYIKKEQIIDLMDEYKTKSFSNNRRYYIIEYAENMNESSANTILKFLEEPNDNITAILVTKNIYNVLDTIVSRCQILNFCNYSDEKFDAEDLQTAMQIFEIIAANEEKSIAYLSDVYKYNADKLKNILNILTYIYVDLAHYKLNLPLYVLSNNLDILKKYSNKYELNYIYDKINVLNDLSMLLKYNVNTRIIVDKLVLD